jgi:hypothetical protein
MVVVVIGERYVLFGGCTLCDDTCFLRSVRRAARLRAVCSTFGMSNVVFMVFTKSISCQHCVGMELVWASMGLYGVFFTSMTTVSKWLRQS